MSLHSVLEVLPSEMARLVRESGIPEEGIREIRFRTGAPPVLVADTVHVLGTERPDAAMLQKISARLCQNSLYARQEELRHGFITLPGGHRAGLSGRTVLEDGRVRALTEISSVNIRIAHEVRGAADSVLPHIVCGREVYNTLVISPPGAGKTTLLRDIARQLGSEKYGFRTGLADERGEIAAMHRGTPGCDVGIFTDVYDGCPKAVAMEMLLRGMSPRVVITDEIGGEADAAAVRDLVRAGVRVIASAHGESRGEVLSRRGVGALLSEGVFQRVVVLGGIGKIVSVSS